MSIRKTRTGSRERPAQEWQNSLGCACWWEIKSTGGVRRDYDAFRGGEFCSLLSSLGWLSRCKATALKSMPYENSHDGGVHRRQPGGGNIAQYGGIPGQIYRARAGLPLRTVYLECSQVYTHLAVVRSVLN